MRVGSQLAVFLGGVLIDSGVWGSGNSSQAELCPGVLGKVYAETCTETE